LSRSGAQLRPRIGYLLCQGTVASDLVIDEALEVVDEEAAQLLECVSVRSLIIPLRNSMGFRVRSSAAAPTKEIYQSMYVYIYVWENYQKPPKKILMPTKTGNDKLMPNFKN
jgi:hypothetical protein